MRAYARHRGISQTAVQQAMRLGVLSSESYKRSGTKVRIDFAAADAEWEQNSAPKPGDDPPPPETNGRRKRGKVETYALARARNESVKADLAELKRAELEGRLVDVDKVRKSWFQLCRTTRDAILNVADSLGPELAAEADEFKAHQMLRTALLDALRELSDEKGVTE